MRIHQFLIAAMTVLIVPLLALLGSISVSSWRDHVEDRSSALVARTTAAWIDGQVALSLERSVTQVAFALETKKRGQLREMLEEQRQLVDRHFERALSHNGDNMKSGDLSSAEFQINAQSLLGELHQTRVEVDQALQRRGACSETCAALVSKLINVIDLSAVLRAVLEIPSEEISTQSYDLLQLQYLAWEAREFAGRARTPYAVATLKAVPFSKPEAVLIHEHLRLTKQIWEILRNVSLRLAPASPIGEAIEEAQRVYYDDHMELMHQIDAALAGEEGKHAPGFEEFFELSTEALAAISTVASLSGKEIENYWREQQDASLRALWLTLFGSVFSISVMVVVLIALRSHIARPIVSTTRLLARVAAGDLEVAVSPPRLSLFEIRKLYEVVERFRMGLKQARAAEVEARTDHLTMLPNRRDMEERFSSDATAFTDGDAFFNIDLDEFKPINDAFGHQTGDKVLKVVADRLRQFNYEGKKVWRIGGDEFAMLVPRVFYADLASNIADRLHESMSAPISHNGEELFVGASIGVAIFDHTVLHPQDMFSRADIAMFTAKQSPTTNVEIHRDTIQSRRYRQESRRRISNALENGEIFPVYQPQVCLSSGRIIGFEALARWRRSDGTLRAPAEFMDMVEYFGAQGELDLLIAGRTLSAMHSIHEGGEFSPRFSINISEESLASREIRGGYLKLFNRYRGLTSKLTVEVTENALIDRSAQAIRASLQSFAAAGVSLSMDDFGTGYGSFRHLQEYQFNEVKIDKSFVDKVCLDRSSEVIISGFLDVARGLGADVVAEGVETSHQRQKLIELGCRRAQGYLFSRAIAETALLEELRTNRLNTDAVQLPPLES
ncbi:ggdef/eal domain-containing protein [Roseibium sp. TrichSKD4]|uniref:putative bifunctional diguanylate cyclase/phosphodiesterase n=1 Tax=Roseibium sp. TrichSKD4 TaxID=744980 RepID=UPI0001E5743D|nr:bifunctional diguanylate cyclase/phosphodiesterase [Roseibium sp. TrichSKD4]EFO30783.1 ggdef/eal domain-containing protein [Roseibium sp. TrichSKD4]